MSANPTASRIAKEYGCGYHEVRIALNVITNAGYSPHNAEDLVTTWARQKERGTRDDELDDAAWEWVEMAKRTTNA